MIGRKIRRAVQKYLGVRSAKKAWIKQIEEMNKTKIYDRRGTSSEAEFREKIKKDMGIGK